MRYRLTREGVYVDDGDNSLELVDRWWESIKADWDKGWVLEDLQPKPDQHCTVWTVCYAAPYNGVELSPLVGTR